MKSIWTIARKELNDSLRNRWLVAISLVFATLALGIAWFGAAATGHVGYASTPATIASLASLGIFLIPLIALLLAYKAAKDLPKLLIQQIEHFFENYKDLEKGKWVKIDGWGEVEEARNEITKAVEAA